MKTVSNVINDYPFISADTRRRVEQAIDEVGYRPNLSARNLARGREGVIALAVPRLEMPYFASLAGEVTSAAEGRGWFVLTRQTDDDPATEQRALAGGFPHRVDGLILASHTLDAEHLAARTDRTPVVVLSDRDLGEGVAQVGIDQFAAGQAAAAHLTGAGARRIALIGADGDAGSRTAGFVAGVESAGIDVPPTFLRSITSNTGTEGERATSALLTDLAAEGEPSPDALFAVTDWVAMGAIRALHAAGLRVPDDVAVMGFDDIPYARDLSPSLTSIRPDRAAIARGALDLLEARMHEADGPPPVRRSIPFTLVERESTRGPVEVPPGR
jgi:DNA-binding LacI/PurR family transcriptional regulator